MKAIAAGFASLMFLPVLVLGSFAGWGVEESVSRTSSAQFGENEDLIAVVLGQPTIVLTPGARMDVVNGRVDPRILAILLAVSEAHTLDRVGPITTGHSYYVRGTTRVSNHVSGRAVDILAVDGAPVSPQNLAARTLMEQLLVLPAPLLADEIGGPWMVGAEGRSSFTNSDHRDHIHVGFDA